MALQFADPTDVHIEYETYFDNHRQTTIPQIINFSTNVNFLNKIFFLFRFHRFNFVEHLILLNFEFSKSLGSQLIIEVRLNY